MASLALPLGPLLRSMPPLRAYAIDIARLDARHRRRSRVLAFLGTGPTAWFVVIGVLLLLLALGAGPTPVVRRRRRRDGPRHRRERRWSQSRARTSGRRTTGSRPTSADLDAGLDRPGRRRPPYYLSVDGIPHQQIWDSKQAASSDLHRQAYALVPGPGVRSRPDHRRRVRDRTSALALAQGRQARRRRRDRPAARPDRPRLPPGGRLQRPAGHRPRQRRPGVPERLAREVRPDHLRADRLADPGQLDGRRPARVVPVHRGVAARPRATTSRPAGCSRCTTSTASRGSSPSSTRCSRDVFGDDRLVRLVGSAERHPRRRSGGRCPRRRAAARRPRRPGARRRLSPSPEPATDDWPFLYLRTRGPSRRTTSPRSRSSCCFAVARRPRRGPGRRARRSAASARTSSSSASRSCCSRRRASCRSACCSGRPGSSTRWRSSRSWPASCWRSWSTSRLRPRNPAPFYAALFVAIAVAYLVPADALLIDPPELRYALAAAIAFAPVFFANLVFTYSFRDTDSADMSFASNLLGAMVGGALEYVALLTGFQVAAAPGRRPVPGGVPARPPVPIPGRRAARRRTRRSRPGRPPPSRRPDGVPRGRTTGAAGSTRAAAGRP